MQEKIKEILERAESQISVAGGDTLDAQTFYDVVDLF